MGGGASVTPGAAGAQAGTNNPLVRISPLYEALLNSADALSNRVHQHSAAVLVAQTAIEVCTQRLIGKLIQARGVAYLDKWMRKQMRNYNIVNSPVRELYEALSSDTQFVNQPFWTSNRLTDHVELRNRIAHRGHIATPAEAQASITVAREVISYLTGIATQHAIDLGD